MASGVVDHLLECPVCLMTQPKLLYCGHSVCTRCMDNLTVGGEGLLDLCCSAHFPVSCVGSNVECPKCRQPSQVPPNGFPTNFQLADLIRRHIKEQNKQNHKCTKCDKIYALDGMVMCHSCDDICLCWRCAFRSHEGHEREELQNHMGNQVKQLQQWKDDKLPVLECLTMLPSTVINKCKSLLDQHHTMQLKIGQKRKDFEIKLRHLVDSSGNELNAGNGYKYDFASLENHFHTIQYELNQSIAKSKQLADVVSQMLQSGEVSEDMTEMGILLTDGRQFELYSRSADTIDIEMEKRDGFVMEVLSDGRVMVAGGEQSNAINQSAPTQIIDLGSKQVMQGPALTTGRCDAASAMIGGQMYLCGGEDDKGNILSSCEVYRDGQWAPIASMKVARCGDAVALDGRLYAIGGRNNTCLSLNSVECYTPNTNSWQLVSSLIVPRCLLSAAVFNGCIYAAGGLGSLKSCERYSPNQNQWETVAPLNKGRHGFPLVAFGNKLYALGGDGEMTVESYDAEKNEWRIEEIALKRRCQKAVVVNHHPN